MTSTISLKGREADLHTPKLPVYLTHISVFDNAYTPNMYFLPPVKCSEQKDFFVKLVFL